jgi:hypothetical protein
MRVLQSGSNAAMNGDTPRVEIARDASTYQRLWGFLVGAGTPPPALDFSRETAVFLLLGTRNTGGYGITPKNVTLEGDVAVIEAEVTSPPRGSMVTQVITAPFAVVAITSPNIANARWSNNGRVIEKTR